LYYTASGIVTRLGSRPVHSLRESSVNLCMGWPHKGVMIPDAV